MPVHKVFVDPTRVVRPFRAPHTPSMLPISGHVGMIPHTYPPPPPPKSTLQFCVVIFPWVLSIWVWSYDAAIAAPQTSQLFPCPLPLPENGYLSCLPQFVRCLTLLSSDDCGGVYHRLCIIQVHLQDDPLKHAH